MGIRRASALLVLLVGCSSDRGSPPAPARPATHHPAQVAPDPDNPIVRENALGGTREWMLSQPASNHELEAYANTTSAAPGESVNVFVSSSADTTFEWTLFRLGYYGGLGGRRISSGDAPLPVSTQEACPAGWDTGLIECHWDATFSLPVGRSMTTGQYVFLLRRADGFETYVPLVVREETPRAPVLYHSNVTTWQAYNVWGGTSLYTNHLPDDAGYSLPRAGQVSFDRPYDSNGDGHLMRWERYLLFWLEKEGYDLAYSTNLDTIADPGILDGRTLWIEGGHDEYWAMAERDAMDAARDSGLSMMFLSANDAYWRIRMDESTSGQPRRIVTCFKDAKEDPHHDAPDTTVEWRQAPHARAEVSLIGQMYELFTDFDGFPFVVSDASHWVYEGTGVANGDAISHIIGPEWDHLFHEGVPDGVETVGESPAIGSYGSTVPSNATVYYPTKSSLVFSGGTIQWPFGLSKPGYTDARLQRLTENVIARAGVPPLEVTDVPAQPVPDDSGIAAHVQVLAGTGVPGHVDGPAAQAQFDAPAGVAVGKDGTLYVTEARNHDIRVISTDGQVSTLAGGGTDDTTTTFRMKNASGKRACFDVPTGIAVADDGTLYVSDAHSYAIRAITPDGHASTYAGAGFRGSTDSDDPSEATFAYPRGLAFGPDGALYVADSYNDEIRRIDASGVTTVATGTQRSSGIAVGPDGTLYVLSIGTNSVGVVKDGAVVSIVNLSGEAGDQAGPGASAKLRPSDGIIVDGARLVISDTANGKVRTVSLSDEHTVTTLAGGGVATEHGNGASARLSNPRGIVKTDAGYVVADSGNHRILRITP